VHIPEPSALFLCGIDGHKIGLETDLIIKKALTGFGTAVVIVFIRMIN
jgi:hypothetical protein